MNVGELVRRASTEAGRGYAGRAGMVPGTAGYCADPPVCQRYGHQQGP